MNSKSTLPFLSLALVFASCTTAYKSGQTPDDVYFSPTRPQDEYVRKDKEEQRQYRDEERQYRYNVEAYRDDRYLRMKIRDRRYVDLYDDYYSYNPYYYHYYNGSLSYNSPWSSYTYWNYYYNPYCSHVVVGNSRTPVVMSKPRTFDLSVYNPAGVGNPKSSRGYSTTTQSTYRPDNSANSNYRGSGNNAGGFLRDVFGGGGNNSSSNNSAPASKASSSSSNSSSSGSPSSGSSNAPTRKF